MWLDRLTGLNISKLPDLIESGRYFCSISAESKHETLFGASGCLVLPGIESVIPKLGRLKFDSVVAAQHAKSELLCRVIETIDKSVAVPGTLISPMMPAAIINSECHLLPFEQMLLNVVEKGHLHHISMHPRVDLHYEDEVIDIARVRRLAKGALVHLASHSECWQRQTLTGVQPKKALARFSEDDFQIYENKVFARLLDKADAHLKRRILMLSDLRANLSQALEFYTSPKLHHLLMSEICSLWGQTFTETETDKASQLLDDTLFTLEHLLQVVRGLKQGLLYQRVDKRLQVGHAIHMTNILSHDAHYRHVAVLWNELAKSNNQHIESPAEYYQKNCYFAKAYSAYAGLVLRHALKPYINDKVSGEWAGLTLSLRQDGLEWQLLAQGKNEEQSDTKILLIAVPWFKLAGNQDDADLGFLDRNKSSRVVFVPDESVIDKTVNTDSNIIPLSPMDLYCVERVGVLLDQVIVSELLNDYAESISKIPGKVLDFISGYAVPTDSAIYSDGIRKVIAVRERVTFDVANNILTLLEQANSTPQAHTLKRRFDEIAALEVCPVCKVQNKLEFQKPLGFRIVCTNCNTTRYLRKNSEGWEFEQQIEKQVDFIKFGRRSFAIKRQNVKAS